jgi:hypothetical protein
LVNAQVEKLFGYRREKLPGCGLEVLVPERFRSEHAEDRLNFMAQRGLGLYAGLQGTLSLAQRRQRISRSRST